MVKESLQFIPILALTFLVESGCSTEKDKPSLVYSVPAQKDIDAIWKSNAAKVREKRINRKLLLFGIDGADWRLMDPLLKEGKLPHFAALIENGVRAPLKTFIPTASPLIWTSIATGVSPDVHGITDFVIPIPETKESLMPTSNMRRVAALWNILSDREVSVGVVGWWATYPAEKVNGFIVSDQASTLHNDSYEVALNIKHASVPHLRKSETYPPALDDEMEKTIAASPDVGLQHLNRFMKLPPKKLAALRNEKRVNIEDIFSIFSVALLIDQAFVVAALYSIEKYRPDFTALYLAGLDHAAEHNFWKYIEPDKFDKERISQDDLERYGSVIDEYYVYMDEVLGRLLKLYPQEELTVMIVSDHGHEANKNYDSRSEDHYNRICSGDHKEAPDGVIIMSGKDIKPGAELTQATVFDIAPTVLALMGVPVGEDMIGRVLTQAFRKEFLEAHPITKVSTHSENRKFSEIPIPSQMSGALTDKLKGLGYIQ